MLLILIALILAAFVGFNAAVIVILLLGLLELFVELNAR